MQSSRSRLPETWTNISCSRYGCRIRREFSISSSKSLTTSSRRFWRLFGRCQSLLSPKHRSLTWETSSTSTWTRWRMVGRMTCLACRRPCWSQWARPCKVDRSWSSASTTRTWSSISSCSSSTSRWKTSDCVATEANWWASAWPRGKRLKMRWKGPRKGFESCTRSCTSSWDSSSAGVGTLKGKYASKAPSRVYKKWKPWSKRGKISRSCFC